MAAEVKITMLGASGTGKTCYMLGLYAVMQLGLQGFTLSTTDPDEDLRLSNMWEQLVEAEGSDRWPPVTGIEPHQYEFNFSYGMRRLISFDWLDYRGGAMNDVSSASDTQTLMERLKKSNCIFLCISGEHLKSAATNDTKFQLKARQAGVTRMNLFLNELGSGLSDRQRPFPIVIVVTKYDQCFQRDKTELMNDIKKMFSTLFMPNQDWLVMVCPVSLGKDLAEDSSVGEIDPKNIHLPLVFALYTKFREYVTTREERVNQTQAKLEGLKSGNWLQRWINSGDSDRTLSELQTSQAQLQEVQTKMALLAQELASAQIFLGGKEIQVDG
jgi:GTPase SAR1 family protein